jgi:hypothetical protein
MGKTNDLSAFKRGMVVGTRRTGLSVSRTAGFFALNSFVCIKYVHSEIIQVPGLLPHVVTLQPHSKMG